MNMDLEHLAIQSAVICFCSSLSNWMLPEVNWNIAISLLLLNYTV